jgi:hypothetical protein
MAIRYALNIAPAWICHADFAVSLLLEAIGIAGTRVEDLSTADLAYSRDVPDNGDDQKPLWIRAQDFSDWNGTNVRIAHSRGLPYIFPNGDHTAAYERSAFGGDPLYSTYALTTGVLERRQKRNAAGVPIATLSELETSGLLATPAIALYATVLQRRLAGCLGPLGTVPRWPRGKKFAIVLSHDVDNPLQRPTEYLRFVLGRLRHGDYYMAARNTLGLARALYRFRQADPPPERDPNFGFEAWLELERRLATKSCFYVAVTKCTDPTAHMNDVGYDFRHPSIIRELNFLIDKGWEVGLHASINARSRPGRFAAERSLLEEHLRGYSLRGLRHHYWSLDAELPERTLREHAAAGFDYDTSFGLSDAPGFRRSIAWPYQPFDPEREKVLPILELPPTVMDGSIFNRPADAAEARKQLWSHVETTKRHGGAVVLDWHVEQMNSARMNRAGPILAEVLTELVGDSDAYWAAPAEVCDWWRERRRKIQALAQTPLVAT